MRCDEFAVHIDGYLNDTLDPGLRDSFREHLQSCRQCRAAAVEAEPSLVFSALPAEAADVDRVENLTQAVLGQIRQERLEQRMRPPRRRWFAAAAAVMLAVVGVTSWRVLSDDDGEAPTTVVEAAQAGEAGPPPRVEVVMPGDNVRVYQYADQQDEDTAVYFIVNPSLEL
jgi:hypothetical protein